MIVWITHAKVGHRQTPYKAKRPSRNGGAFCFMGLKSELLEELLIVAQFWSGVVVVTVLYTVIGLDENFMLVFFCRIYKNIQVVSGGAFTVVNHLAADTMQRAMVEVDPFLRMAIFQATEGVAVQVCK
jgi:hypothetical protein